MTRKQENTRVRRSGSAHTTPTTTTTPTFFGGGRQQELLPYKKGKAQLCKQEASAPLPIPGNNNNSNFFWGGRTTTTSAPEGKRITLQATSHNLNLNLGGQTTTTSRLFLGGAEQQLLLYKKDKAQLCKQKATVPTPAPDNNNNDFNLYLWEQGGAEPQPPLVHDPACPSSMGSSHFGWNQVNTHPKKRCHLRTHWLKSNHEATFSSLSAGFSMYRPVGHGIRSPGLVPVLPVFNPIG